jgi:GTP-binding protein HflX
MSTKIAEPTKPEKERAFLVGVEVHSQPGLISMQDSLEELERLADTAGLDVVGELTQKIDRPSSDTYIGSGKVEELRAFTEETLADVIIFDVDLSPRHQRELEKVFGTEVRILDRTALILDIFAQHASTREGYLQVELAQLEYRLPRLTRAWTHLARQAGGGGGRAGGVGGVGLRGPGETQLEVDRREIGHRIHKLKEEIEKIREHRNQYRQQRKRARTPIVALVGYTNAGKSTLLNTLAKTDIYAADQLFATLDPTTRRVSLPDGQIILLTDTVGFIQKLPTQLIAAFRATLEEISEADLLLHVIDGTHPIALQQAQSVKQTLEQIGAGSIPTISVLNKVDELEKEEIVQLVRDTFPGAVPISGLRGLGMEILLEKIEHDLFQSLLPVHIHLPYTEGQLISMFHENGVIDSIKYNAKVVDIRGKIPGRMYARFQPFEV